MRLRELIGRPVPPAPWAEGEKIPWDEPAFSERMLAEHLSQDHDAASRRFDTIERQVAWIHDELLSRRPGRVLDLGCGPGLYTSRLAALGHECVGIDYSPASVAYATARAKEEGIRCTYIHGDIREADFGAGFGLVMLIYGEFNVFRPEEAAAILHKAYGALVEGGLLFLEPHPLSAVKRIGERPTSWRACEKGLFSDGPHLLLTENFWAEESATATTRYFVIGAATGDVARYAETYRAYTEEQYRALLDESGFEIVTFGPSEAGPAAGPEGELLAIVARKGREA